MAPWLKWTSLLPRGRNFGRKAQKGPKKNCRGRESQGLNFCTFCPKRAELFSSLVFHKIICISCSTDYAYKLVYISFLTTLDLEPLKKLQN
jgi:hypothetical protein